MTSFLGTFIRQFAVWVAASLLAVQLICIPAYSESPKDKAKRLLQSGKDAITQGAETIKNDAKKIEETVKQEVTAVTAGPDGTASQQRAEALKKKFQAKFQAALEKFSSIAEQYKLAGFVLSEVHLELDLSPDVIAQFAVHGSSTDSETSALAALEGQKRAQEFLEKLIAARKMAIAGYGPKAFSLQFSLLDGLPTRLTAIMEPN